MDPELIKRWWAAEPLANIGGRMGGDGDEWITVRETSKMTKFSEWTIYAAINRGELPAFRPSPKRIRIRWGALREYASRREGAGQNSVRRATPRDRVSGL